MADEIDRIGETFKGKSVFISGATGFLGKVLIEKLLRVTHVKKLYLLVRQKKATSPKDRMQELFNHVLFSVLRKERPESFSKCIVISGDVTAKDLGITESDRELLRNEIDYIIHSAATTRFDDTLTYSLQMNTLGTKYMLDLAKECKKLKLFVHVSTAFAFPKENILYEKTYEPPADPQDVLNKMFSGKEDSSTDEFAKEVLQDCPNTYTFSKALAEGLVNKEMGKLPAIIVRPSVVTPIFKEPLPGFFNNLQSPMGIFVGAGKGVIRTMFMDPHSNANMVPVDSVINGLLVASWDYLNCKQNRVFNLSVPQEDLRISWEEIIEMGRDVVTTKIPFNGIVWYPGGEPTKNRWWNHVNLVLFQLIPALFIDLLLRCLGYKPILFGINQRLMKGQEMFEYYTTKAWSFNMDYFLTMRRKMNAKEAKIYQVEAVNVNIPEYLKECMLYARRHIFKETDDMLPAARRNIKIFFVLDRIVKVGFFVLVFYYIYNVLFTKNI